MDSTRFENGMLLSEKLIMPVASVYLLMCAPWVFGGGVLQ